MNHDINDISALLQSKIDIQLSPVSAGYHNFHYIRIDGKWEIWNSMGHRIKIGDLPDFFDHSGYSLTVFKK